MILVDPTRNGMSQVMINTRNLSLSRRHSHWLHDDLKER